MNALFSDSFAKSCLQCQQRNVQLLQFVVIRSNKLCAAVCFIDLIFKLGDMHVRDNNYDLSINLALLQRKYNSNNHLGLFFRISRS